MDLSYNTTFSSLATNKVGLLKNCPLASFHSLCFAQSYFSALGLDKA